MTGSLYVVSTPIGNLDDITVRAINTLKSVGLVAAEDTRRTGLLFRHFGIATPTTSLHEHNEHEKQPALIAKLKQGVNIALVSDAGTPVVCDPGQRLIASAITQGIRIVPIPGASAALAALAASGYGGDEFVFAGFAPIRSRDRRQWLLSLSNEQRVVVFFEAPHRIAKTLKDLSDLLAERPITVARELTKLHETVISTTGRKLATLTIPERGEFTLVLGPWRPSNQERVSVSDADLQSYFDQMTNTGGLSRRAATAATAARFGLSTNDVYAKLESLKNASPP